EFLITNLKLEHCNQTFAALHGYINPIDLKSITLGALYKDGYNLNRLVSVLMSNQLLVTNFETR
ncbi:MAG: hypothetical protein KDC92_11580, partial [Bacteroidetes bacterium]|nr:hypothetical protein [Bacteroidota bacterium]